MHSVWRITAALTAAGLVLAAVQPVAAKPESALAGALREQLQRTAAPPSIHCAGERLLRPADVRAFYRLRDFAPYWQDGERLHRDTEAVLEILNGADREGLQPADYHVDALRRVMAARATLNTVNPEVSAPVQADLELLLTDAVLCYGHDAAHGRIDAEALYENWQNAKHAFDPILALTGVLAGGASPRIALAALRPPHPEYALLVSSLARYRAIRAEGGWPRIPAGETLRPGDRDPRVPLLREFLRVTGDLPAEPLVNDLPRQPPQGIPLIPTVEPVATAEPAPVDELLYDDRLVRATERFQVRHGLDEDGVIGTKTLAAFNVPVEERIDLITLNLERLRWLPRDFGERYIRVNIPELRLDVIEGRQTRLSMRAIVGRADRPTPVFSGRLTYLEFNPYWTIPRRLAQEDVLPHVIDDPGYLIERDIRVYSDWRLQAPEIDPYSIDWTVIDPEELPYKLRQAPGPSNPLGRVKFMFPNDFAVYIHDTTSPAKFRRASRYYSSGCIRIEDPIALADYLLSSRQDWGTDRAREIITSRENKTVGVQQPIPVHLLYLSSWVSAGGLVHFRDDVYSYDALLRDALVARGASLTAERIASLADSEGTKVGSGAAVARAEAGRSPLAPTSTQSASGIERSTGGTTPTVNTTSALPRAGGIPDRD